MNVNRLANELEKFQTEIAKNLYETHMGTKKASDIKGIYSSFKNILDEENIINLISNKEILETDEYTLFLKATVKEYLLLFAQFYKSKAAIYRSNETIEFYDEKLSLKEAQARVLIEKNRNKRKLLYKNIEKANDEVISPIFVEMYENLNEIANRLGYESYLNLSLSLNSLDADKSIEELENFLNTTKDKYTRKFEEIYQHQLININHNERHDAFHLWNLIKFPNGISFDNLKLLLEDLMRDLGLEEVYNKIKITIQNVGFQRSFTLPINIPTDIALIISLRNKFDDYKTLFHEVGHSLHLVSTSKQLPSFYRCWGDSGINEAYAFLFENLLVNPKFLERYIDGSRNLIDFLNMANFNRFFFIRLYAAKALWELKYSDNDNFTIEQKKEAWGEIFYSATGFKYEGASAYIEREFFLNTFNYLKGWVLELQLKEYLENNFGEYWFRNKDSGCFLQSLWSTGKFRTGEDLSSVLGSSTFNFNILKKYVDFF